jgi:hypothetical protein
MNAPAPDALTVLHAPGRRLAKLLHPDGRAEGYDRTRIVDAYTVPIADLAGIQVLLQRLRHRPDCCVVRGELVNGDVAVGIRRLLHADKETGEAPTIRDVPRRWLALDMEGVTLPPGLLPSDLAGCAAVALATLPTELRGAACIVQASASHGMKPDLRLHLWWWLDRPMWGHELKRWMCGTPADPSVFGAVQPIYTASPMFASGCLDPLPTRVLLLDGAPVVTAPRSDVLVPPPSRLRPAVWEQTAPRSTTSYVRKALICAVARLTCAANGNWRR